MTPSSGQLSLTLNTPVRAVPCQSWALRRGRGIGVALSGVALAVGAAFPAAADTLSWVGAGASNTFSTAANWSGAKAPLAGDSLSFASLASGAYAAVNDLVGVPLGSLSFSGGQYVINSGALSLQRSEFDSRVISVTGGAQTLNGSVLSLQPLVLNRVVTQEIFNDHLLAVSNGGSLTLNTKIAVAAPTLLPGLDLTGGAKLPPPAILTASVGTGSSLNFGGELSGFSQLSVNGAGATRFQGAGALMAVGGAKPAVFVGNYEYGRPSPSSLVLDNSGQAVGQRLAGADVTLFGASSLQLIGHGSTAVRESVGALKSIATDVELGKVLSRLSIRVDSSGASTVLALGSGSSLGYVDFHSNGSLGDQARVVFASAPALSNGLMAKATVGGFEFAGYDATAMADGLHRGVVSATSRASFADAVAGDNVYVANGSFSLPAAAGTPAGLAINSLAANNAQIGAGTLVLGSGRALLNGNNSIQAGIALGTQPGLIDVRTGQTSLSGGLHGSAGAALLGQGSLELSGAASTLSGVLDVGLSKLTLSADNLLTQASLDVSTNRTTIDIGSTSQSFVNFTHEGGSLLGTGSISAQRMLINGAGLVSANLSAGDMSLYYGRTTGTLSASKTLTLSGAEVAGAISGAATLTVQGSASTLTANAAHTGATMISNANYTPYDGGLALSGAGALSSTPSVTISAGTTLWSNYATPAGTTAFDRINDNAAIQLVGGTLRLSETGSPAVQTVEKIGALSVTGNSGSFIGMSGNVGLLADSLSVAAGSRLLVDLGSQGSLKFVTAPVADGAVLPNVMANRTVTTASVTNGVLPVWATYSNARGVQTEHPVGSLAGAGSGAIVRVTDAFNGAVDGNVAVQAALLDTAQAVTGSGTLTVDKGLAFLQDNTVSVARLNLGVGAMLSNAGTNTITSTLSGTSLDKRGQGQLVLAGNANISNGVTVSYGGDKLVVAGTLSANTVSGGVIVTGSLTANSVSGIMTLRNGGQFVGRDADYVRLENSSFTVGASQSVSSVEVDNRSSLSNLGKLGGASVSGGYLLNKGEIGPYSGVGVSGGSLTNQGKMNVTNLSLSTGDNASGQRVKGQFVNEALGQFTSGSVHNDGGLISNDGGSFVLIAGGSYYDYTSASPTLAASDFAFQQTAGKTRIDGTFNGNINLTGGVLDGLGSITGRVVASNGAQIKPGHSPGQLAIQDLVLQSGATLELDVASTGSDKLIIGGSFIAEAGSKVSLHLYDEGKKVEDLVGLKLTDFFQFAGAAPDLNSLSYGATDSAGNSFTLALGADGSVGSVAAVPEPQTWLSLTAGLGLLGAVTRRRSAAVRRG